MLKKLLLFADFPSAFSLNRMKCFALQSAQKKGLLILAPHILAFCAAEELRGRLIRWPCLYKPPASALVAAFRAFFCCFRQCSLIFFYDYKFVFFWWTGYLIALLYIFLFPTRAAFCLAIACRQHYRAAFAELHSNNLFRNR